MELEDIYVTRYSPLTIWFSPLHRVHRSDSILKVEVQRDIELSCPEQTDNALFAFNSDIFARNFRSSCGYTDDGFDEYILIDNIFNENYKYVEGQDPLKIVLFNTRAPRRQVDIKRLRITVMNQNNRIIDLYETDDRVFFKILAAPLVASKLTYDTKHTYTDAVFEITARIAVTL